MAENMEGVEATTTTAAMLAEAGMPGFGPDVGYGFNSEKFSNLMLEIEVLAGGRSGPDSVSNNQEKADKGQAIDSSSTRAVLTVKTLYINSLILAGRSPFFLKLFTNGMKESNETHPRISIADSEENALMELLRFMYSGKLTTIEPTLLLDILMAADKFEVLSCMSHCSQLLTSLPMTTDSALLYLDHPCSSLIAAEVQSVVRVAKEFLADKYKDFHKFEAEVLNISLVGIEAIFSSTDLMLLSEDEAYYFLLKWVRRRYPELEERRKIWSCRLLPLVRFSHMTGLSLQRILACTDDDIVHEQVAKRIAEVLLYKAYPTQMEGTLAAEVATHHQFAERTYELKAVKVVAFDRPCRQVTVYMDLKRDECSQLFSTGNIASDWFGLGGQKYCLLPHCTLDEQTNFYTFGLWIVTIGEPTDSVCLTVDIQIAVRTKPLGNFVSMLEYRHEFTGDDWTAGCNDLFGIPWSTFIDDDTLFIDDVLHLAAILTLVEQPELQI
ncbi:Kelch-like ECH-associated protein 1 [Hordeum vulgare]|uniref:Predicted protein n=1 Tax=Hordeum vulgare subsp. vulgare TaxID=112509 RepID=F2EI57_HORVV|nr:BTB/POZ domain-containing protein POB1-like [Hordeum vulgare subsp. vulgare]KAE8777022.1 Kelch-like ECH-associated protein 1 [Hordeum vulgare]BAK07029.1 predicted protein [Hordeum vulgare subsp. vulgare]